MSTVVVTGATGFVMASVARHLAGHALDVVAADLHPPDEALAGYLAGPRGAVRFRRVDVTDADAVAALLGETRPERLVHGAALTSIPPDVERARFVRTAEVNVLGTLRVLDAAREARVGRIVVISSGSVYGARPDLAPIAEEDPHRPVELYPATKWAADALARRFAQVHGLDLVVARLASPFGPFERDTGSRPLLSPIREWVAAALRGEPVRVLGPAPPARDWAFVADIASGIAALTLAGGLAHQAYNVGWGRLTSVEEALAALGRVAPGLAVERRPDEPSPWRVSPARGPLAIDRLCADTGWAPQHDIVSGVAAYLDWARAHPDIV